MDVAGVDGCAGGWLVAYVQDDGLLHVISLAVLPSFAEVLSRTKQCEVVGIDIPIGLSDDDRRRADVETRYALRPYRHPSVFPAPIRPVLSAATYSEANELSSKLHRHGKKISQQTWSLVPKVADVDRGITPELQKRVIEVHPEASFRAMNNDAPLEQKKRSENGATQRVALLSRWFSDDLPALEIPPRAAPDDVLDSLAAAWTAARHARGEARRFPIAEERDARGLRMEIVY